MSVELQTPTTETVPIDAQANLTPSPDQSSTDAFGCDSLSAVEMTPRQTWEASLRDYYGSMTTRTPSRTHYYYQQIIHRVKHLVFPGARVLDIGCGNGDLLAQLQPSYGLGVDFDQRAVAEASDRHPDLHFRHLSGERVDTLGETFDYVIISQTLGDIYDLQELFRAIQGVCHERTRVIIVHYSRLWQPILRVAEWLGIKSKAPDRNWLPAAEISHLLGLSGFETIRLFCTTPCPVHVPLVSDIANRFVGNLPGIHALGLTSVIVARSVDERVVRRGVERSVSIVVPARNEAGHIRRLLARIPTLSPRQEVIFVEGNSDDHTWEVIRRVVAEYDGPWQVSCMKQDGKGKGDAVRKGFAAATGEVLMILDADISVPPEELTDFYRTLIEGHGELINGSRMVYLMDKKAMRFLNLLGNRFFGAMFTMLLSQRFRDTLCGTKVLLREDYEKRIASARGYLGDFDPFGDFDLLFGAARAGLKITDVPVHYQARTYGDTNISRFRHGLILLRMCLFAARKLRFV